MLVKEWGEDYARDVLDITICITEKDRSEAASFRAQFHDCALFKNRKVVFIRPKLGQIVEEHVLNLSKYSATYASWRFDARKHIFSKPTVINLHLYLFYS